MRIAIVGAGSAGMAMAKQLLDANGRRGATIEFVVFERRNEVGGIWQHDAIVEDGYLAWEEEDGSLSNVTKATKGEQRIRFAWHGVIQPGPMFEGLRTNIPCDLMSFRDELIPAAYRNDLFPSRASVQAYLEAYASKYELRKNVRFSTNVTRIAKNVVGGDEEGGSNWIVESESIDGQTGRQTTTEYFDRICLANGRCNTPSIPSIEGLDTFSGRVMHSAWYRDPTQVLRPGERPTVLVVGNASSGMDIARELSGFATRSLPCGLSADEWHDAWTKSPISVISSWHSLDKPPPMDYNPLDESSPGWCKRIRVVGQIRSIDGPIITLDDGRTLTEVALIIFATGYAFDCSFLDQSVGPLRHFPLLPPAKHHPTNKGRPSGSMFNMDDWLVMHAHDESLAILGLPITVVPFPFTEIQAFYIVNRWLGQADKLPLLDRNVPVNDERRWSTRRHQTNGIFDDHSHDRDDDDKVTLRPMAHVFGKPSDHAYLNALLHFVHLPDDEHVGTPVPWMDEYTSDGAGEGSPRGPEAMYAISPWREERRQNTRILRRTTLGY